ncbi:hypothetical protein H2248_011730 [Termitomyces sp. 'cryptogamus']|nr:hypothetical protein H2248_011730 [Termitomyces sp. 'cryptogamus']
MLFISINVKMFSIDEHITLSLTSQLMGITSRGCRQNRLLPHPHSHCLYRPLYFYALGFSMTESIEELIQDRVAVAFIALQLIGECGLLIVAITALFGQGVNRNSMWYSFIGSWIFSCTSYTLLAFAGQGTGPEPDLGLCLVQGALIYAAPSLTGCTTLAFVFHMLLNMHSLEESIPFGTDFGTMVVASPMWT